MSFQPSQTHGNYWTDSTETTGSVYIGRNLSSDEASTPQISPSSFARIAEDVNGFSVNHPQLLHRLEINNPTVYHYGHYQPDYETNIQPFDPTAESTYSSFSRPDSHIVRGPSQNYDSLRNVAENGSFGWVSHEFEPNMNLPLIQELDERLTSNDTRHPMISPAASSDSFPTALPPPASSPPTLRFSVTSSSLLPTPRRTLRPICPRCPKTFKRKSDMERHARVHELPTHFCGIVRCKYNTRGFYRKDKLTDHMKIHGRSVS
ncbi:MAG: hypothetical protein MMC33_002279 [Icmadophila ericetorum]|nr:hypothetical protein [Icmadophila ericetorum]